MCTHDPKETIGSIGMYHCPECGEVVVAGLEHPDYSLLDEYTNEECNKQCGYTRCKNVVMWHVIDSNDDCFLCNSHKEEWQRNPSNDGMQYVSIAPN